MFGTVTWPSRSSDWMIYASGHHMEVVVEQIRRAVERTAESHGPLLAILRLTGAAATPVRSAVQAKRSARQSGAVRPCVHAIHAAKKRRRQGSAPGARQSAAGCAGGQAGRNRPQLRQGWRLYRSPRAGMWLPQRRRLNQRTLPQARRTPDNHRRRRKRQADKTLPQCRLRFGPREVSASAHFDLLVASLFIKTGRDLLRL